MARVAHETPMSSSGTPLKLVTVGDFDPQSDNAIEYDFIGRVIAGRYTVQEHIGGGGMADVFRASDGELGIDVAIKLLKPRMASDELRARMVQEAQAAAQVRHSNLVRVFGTGKLDATAYIAMEMLRGPNLEQYLRARPQQRLPWHEALELMLPAIAALHAVHERGFVHRDIKPGNILVTSEPGCPPTAIVIDLGLVKPDRALRNAASPPTTEAGRMLCTPGYTSPEQAAGLPVDRRSDVYSLAITLYRVLAGRLPFHDARGQPVFVVLAKHIYNAPTRLGEAAAGADIPPAIATVIESALRKDPKDRPQTMLAFAEALRAAAAGSAPTQSSLRRRPHVLLLVLAAAVAIAWLFVPAPASPRAVNLGPERISAPAPGSWVLADARRFPPAAPTSSDTTAHISPTPAPSDTTTHISPPAPGDTTAHRSPPAPAPTTRAGEQHDLAAAARRALARRTPAVQRCADASTGGSNRLAVAMKIDMEGRVSAHVVDAVDTPLSRCIDRALRHTHLLPPLQPLSFVQTFKLRATPHRP